MIKMLLREKNIHEEGQFSATNYYLISLGLDEYYIVSGWLLQPEDAICLGKKQYSIGSYNYFPQVEKFVNKKEALSNWGAIV